MRYRFLSIRFPLWLLLFCLLQPAVTFAQQTEQPKKKKVTITPLPAIFYQPETSLGLGVLGIATFRLDEDSLTRTSNVQILAAYTLNRQIINENTYNLFFPGEKYVINGEISFYDFPIYYYGVGNQTPDADTDIDAEKNQIDITYNLLYVHNRFLRKVRGPFFAGLQQRFTYLYELQWQPASRILDRPTTELDNYSTSGAGAVLLFDNRNSVLNASSGTYAEFSTLHNFGALGSEFGFSRYVVDLRKFVQPREGTVLAVQGVGNFSTGHVPFREMALLGGQNIMRGYYKGRFRDNHSVAFQGEIRQRVWRRFGVVAFASVGDVASEVNDLDLFEYKVAAGGGIRFMINQKDRVNIRIDYGIGKNTSGLYFGIAEAF